MRWTTIAIAVTLLTVPAAAMAGHGNGNGGGHDTFPGLPNAAFFGICTAYENNQNGQENGQAGEAPPFQWLSDQAEEEEQTVEEWCAENGQHPGQGNGPDNGQGNGQGNAPGNE